MSRNTESIHGVEPVGTADVKYCNALVLGWIATSVFRTPIASGQMMGRKNLIFRNGDDTHIHNQDEVLYIMATILRRLTGKNIGCLV